MKSTHSSMCSVSNRSKLREPPGRWCTDTRRSRVSLKDESRDGKPLMTFPLSRTAGVKAPLTRERASCLWLGEEGVVGVSFPGDMDSGVITPPLCTLDPFVAMTDGDVGGSGERVK